MSDIGLVGRYGQRSGSGMMETLLALLGLAASGRLHCSFATRMLDRAIAEAAMRDWALLALSIVSGAQDGTSPVPAPAVIDPDGADVLDANRTASSAAAAQTAKLLQDKNANARNIADYEKARADYVRKVAEYEAQTAAIARKAALDAEAYRQSMAIWQNDIDRRKLALRKSAKAVPATKAEPKVICRYERQTGSFMQERVCRSSADRR